MWRARCSWGAPLTTLVLCMVHLGSVLCSETLELNVTIPKTYKITSTDEYVCTIVALPEQPSKLVGVVPLADQSVVHHMLLFGCQEPAQKPKPGESFAWNCMHHGVCGQGGSEILYGWGRNAPALNLPEGVAFSVGKGTAIKYIVAQVHFKDVTEVDDKSGVTLKLRPQATPFAAGLITFASMFTIPANTPLTKVPTECCYLGHQPLTTFAFRVHTHALGRAVYMTRPNWTDPGVTETVALNNPQLPQAFYPVKRQVIWPGDKLKVTCDFNSTGRNRVTEAGSTSEDEMCNMYMMVYAPHPFISMCGGQEIMTTQDGMPGTMAAAGTLVEDPCPFWQPPGKVAGKQPAVTEKTNLNGGLGDAVGVAVAMDGTLWAFHRGSHHWDYDTFTADNVMTNKELIHDPVIVQMDPATGKVVKRLGGNLLSMPHMITLDHENNIWVVDVGLHQVIKLNQDGEVLLTLGTQFKPGAGKDKFCKPTHVAVARDGSFWVADGYCNSRVVHFDADGKYQFEVAIQGGGVPVVHSVVLDECRNRLYVALREWGKVAFIDIPSKAVSEVKDLSGLGMVWSLVMGPYGDPLALTWRPNENAHIVNIHQSDSKKWIIPGMKSQHVHQLALGAAPPVLSGAADRLFAVYVASTCCGPLQRFVLVPPGYKLPDVAQLVLPPASQSTEGVPLSPGEQERADADKQLAKEEQEEEKEVEEELEEELEEEEEEEEVEELKEELEAELADDDAGPLEKEEMIKEEQELEAELLARQKERQAKRKDKGKSKEASAPAGPVRPAPEQGGDKAATGGGDKSVVSAGGKDSQVATSSEGKDVDKAGDKAAPAKDVDKAGDKAAPAKDKQPAAAPTGSEKDEMAGKASDGSGGGGGDKGAAGGKQAKTSGGSGSGGEAKSTQDQSSKDQSSKDQSSKDQSSKDFEEDEDEGEADDDDDEAGEQTLSPYDSDKSSTGKAATQSGTAATKSGDAQQGSDGDNVVDGSHMGARDRAPASDDATSKVGGDDDASKQAATPGGTPGGAARGRSPGRRPGHKHRHRQHNGQRQHTARDRNADGSHAQLSAEETDHVIGSDVEEGWMVAEGGWRGSAGARLLAFLVFAAVMAGLMFLVSRKLMRRWYGDGGDDQQQVGRGVKYKKASIDEMLARSAELDALEDGSMGQQFHHVNGHGKAPSAASTNDKAPLLATEMAIRSSNK